MSLCYRPSGQGVGVFAGIIAEGGCLGRGGGSNWFKDLTPWSTAEPYRSPKTTQSLARCPRGRSSPRVSLAAGATRGHYQVSSHRGWAFCDRGGGSLQLHEFGVMRHLGDPDGKLPYASGARQMPWVATASHSSGDAVTAQGLEVALSFLVLNEIICSHANDPKSVSMTATTDPVPYFPNLPVNLSKP